MGPLPVRKTENVAVSPGPIVAVALLVGVVGLMQAPVDGSVSHNVKVPGSSTEPVSALAVIDPVIPTLNVATASAAEPVSAGISTTPSPDAMAMMSGTGVLAADNSSVLTPLMVAAGFVLVQSKLN